MSSSHYIAHTSTLFTYIIILSAMGIPYSTSMPPPSTELDQLERQAHQGNLSAAFDLAYTFDTGQHGVPVNGPRAVELYETAVQQGHIPAMYNLGIVYHNGRHGFPRNARRAKELYTSRVVISMRYSTLAFCNTTARTACLLILSVPRICWRGPHRQGTLTLAMCPVTYFLTVQLE